MTDSIPKFVTDLAEKNLKALSLWNMYVQCDTYVEPLHAPDTRRALLIDYLREGQNRQYALIGLAPGYAGARFSGEPFNDEAHIHAKTGIRLSKRVQPWQEETSRVVQSAFGALNIRNDVVCWNALPFHPYNQGEPLTNRDPKWTEIVDHGIPFLARFLELIRPGTVIPVGRMAERALDVMKVPHARYVRHPSHGGSSLFLRGLLTTVEEQEANRRAKEEQLRAPSGSDIAGRREETGIPEGQQS